TQTVCQASFTAITTLLSNNKKGGGFYPPPICLCRSPAPTAGHRKLQLQLWNAHAIEVCRIREAAICIRRRIHVRSPRSQQICCFQQRSGRPIQNQLGIWTRNVGRRER